MFRNVVHAMDNSTPWVADAPLPAMNTRASDPIAEVSRCGQRTSGLVGGGWDGLHLQAWL